jgi:Flp pilus assembly protein TadD
VTFRHPAPWLLAAILALLTLLSYRDVGDAGFVNLDDDAYVEFAPMVNRGFRAPALAWAFTDIHSSNWHPLTTLSHMLDCTVFGVRPGPMHWENVGWHVLNTLLVFLVWRRLSGALWRPALVAALFALHPLHVESVAWISSRKDLLATFWWLLGLLAYARWSESPSRPRYAALVGCLAGALLSKPIAVTFPATLLLLDFWPLRRWPERAWWPLVREKLPLFGLVLLHSVITYVVQHASGAGDYAARIPLDARVGNALVSYVRYLGKTTWPGSLAPMYPHPGYWPAWVWAGSLLVLAGLGILAWRGRRPHPWLAFGGLWFLGTLLPMIGLIQVGAQAMADRYTYVPLLGVFTAAVWAGAELSRHRSRRQAGAATLAGGAVLACLLLTPRQVRAWRDSLALYDHSIQVGEDGAAVRFLRAAALAAAGRPEAEVIAEFRRALALEPDYVNAYTQLAKIALQRGRMDEAERLVTQTILLEPKNPSLRGNLAALTLIRGDAPRALELYREVLRMAPNSAGTHREIARILLQLGRPDEAEPHFGAVLRGDRWNAGDHAQLAELLARRGELAAARRLAERGLWLEPGHEPSRAVLARLDGRTGTARP